MAFAKGTHAIAICPRCGFQVKYLSLRQEWTGRWVCPDCWDPKHPQLETKPIGSDAIGLEHPAVDRDDMGEVEQQLYEVVTDITHGDRQAGDG